MRGELFALLTLAVTFVVGTIVVNTPIDGGPGVSLGAVPVPAIGPTPSSTFYLLALAAATLTLLVAWAIFVSRFGAGLFAIHDDEDAAEVMGVPTYRYKLVALALSCALAGVAGGIQALFLSYVTVGEVFTITVPLTVVLMSVLGGTRHWAGPAIGAVAITGLLYSFTAADHAVAGKAAIGAILIAAILFMPDGILPRLQRAFRRRVPARAGRRPAPRRPLATRRHRRRRRRAAPRSIAAARARPAQVISRACGRSPASTSRCGAARSSACSGRTARASRPSSTSSAATTRPARARSSSRATRSTRRPPTASPRAGIARTYQIPRPFAHMTVLDNVALAAMFGGAIAIRPRRAARGAAVAGVHRPRRPRPTRCPTTSTCTSASSSSSRGRWRRGRAWCCSTKCCAG